MKEKLKAKTVATESLPTLKDPWSWDGPLVLSQIETRGPGFLLSYLPDMGPWLSLERAASSG